MNPPASPRSARAARPALRSRPVARSSLTTSWSPPTTTPSTWACSTGGCFRSTCAYSSRGPSPEGLAALGWGRREGVIDSRRLFHYFRLTEDHRVLFGGGVPHYQFGGGTEDGPPSGAAVDQRRGDRSLRRTPARGWWCGGAGGPAVVPRPSPAAAAGTTALAGRAHRLQGHAVLDRI